MESTENRENDDAFGTCRKYRRHRGFQTLKSMKRCKTPMQSACAQHVAAFLVLFLEYRDSVLFVVSRALTGIGRDPSTD